MTSETSYISQATAAYTSTPAVVSKPASTATGDLLIMIFMVDYQDNGSSIPAPTGWTVEADNTLFGNYLQTDHVGYAVFWKIVTASEPSTYSVAYTTTNGRAESVVMCYRGVNQYRPIDYALAAENDPFDFGTPGVYEFSMDSPLSYSLGLDNEQLALACWVGAKNTQHSTATMTTQPGVTRRVYYRDGTVGIPITIDEKNMNHLTGDNQWPYPGGVETTNVQYTAYWFFIAINSTTAAYRYLTIGPLLDDLGDPIGNTQFSYSITYTSSSLPGARAELSKMTTASGACGPLVWYEGLASSNDDGLVVIKVPYTSNTPKPIVLLKASSGQVFLMSREQLLFTRRIDDYFGDLQ